MTAYDDIKCLKETGYWPNTEIPSWALEGARRLQCMPTHSAVAEIELMKEIETLRGKLNQLTPEERNRVEQQHAFVESCQVGYDSISKPLVEALGGHWTERDNQRRAILIDKEIAGTLTHDEMIELNELQAVMAASDKTTKKAFGQHTERQEEVFQTPYQPNVIRLREDHQSNTSNASE